MTDLDRLLDFAGRSLVEDGGFGYLGDDGHVLADRPAETWIVARMTHVFGLAALLGRESAADFVASLERPRRVLIMVKAGAPTDAVIDEFAPLLEPGDMLIDAGNAHFADTRRREAALK